MFTSGRDIATRPRPPVPPRPNKHVLQESVSKLRVKTTSVRTQDVVTNNMDSLCKTNDSFIKSAHLGRVRLGQHVHENEPLSWQNRNRKPTVLLISNGKTLVQDESCKIDVPKMRFQDTPSTALRESPPKIKQQNWYQVEEESGRPVKYSSCQITLDDDDSSSSSSPITQRPRAVSMSLQGLPPLPKSLSGINLLESVKVTTPTTVQTDSPRNSVTRQIRIPSTPPPPPPSEPKKQSQRKLTTLDTQLAILRKEMVSNFCVWHGGFSISYFLK